MHTKTHNLPMLTTAKLKQFKCSLKACCKIFSVYKTMSIAKIK